MIPTFWLFVQNYFRLIILLFEMLWIQLTTCNIAHKPQAGHWLNCFPSHTFYMPYSLSCFGGIFMFAHQYLYIFKYINHLFELRSEQNMFILPSFKTLQITCNYMHSPASYLFGLHIPLNFMHLLLKLCINYQVI